jgi:hypothetical protein
MISWLFIVYILIAVAVFGVIFGVIKILGIIGSVKE